MTSKWISVDDRLPEEDGLYLAYYPSELHKHQIVWFDLRFNCFNCYHEDITHWLPLPNLPEGE